MSEQKCAKKHHPCIHGSTVQSVNVMLSNLTGIADITEVPSDHDDNQEDQEDGIETAVNQALRSSVVNEVNKISSDPSPAECCDSIIESGKVEMEDHDGFDKNKMPIKEGRCKET